MWKGERHMCAFHLHHQHWSTSIVQITTGREMIQCYSAKLRLLAWATASFTRFFHAHGADHPLRMTFGSRRTGHGRLMLGVANIKMAALTKIAKLYSNTWANIATNGHRLQKYSLSFLFYDAMDSVQHIAMNTGQARGYRRLKTCRKLERLTRRLSDLPKMNKAIDFILMY